MRVGIMQPYFLPYIGYWQLMAAVDKYVVYDDVNYIKGGWINRNRILLDGKPHYLNVPMLGSGSFKKINEIGVNNEEKLIQKNLRMVEHAYKKAPYFEKVYPIIKQILECRKEILSEYIVESFSIIKKYLMIDTELILSSQQKKDCSLKGQDKVIAICKLLGATEYVNAIGGQELYIYDDFEKAHINLFFLKTEDVIYKQFEHPFLCDLSILDVMMFNSQDEIGEMLNKYVLITQ